MSETNRHHRQALLPFVGEEGQARLRAAHALVVGVGALGCAAADLLARAGVGRLTLVDRDVVEPTNLQRQTFYTEADLGKPKAEVAARRVRAIDSSIDVRGVVADFTAEFARAAARGSRGTDGLPSPRPSPRGGGSVGAAVCGGDAHRDAQGGMRAAGRADVLVDGTDNFETRYLLNDLAVATDTPYVYAGVVGTRGMTLSVIPGATACLRCAFEAPPSAGEFETCDTAGVFGPAVMAVAAQQAASALKILLGRVEEVDRALLVMDLWTNETKRVAVEGPRGDCPCCGRREFDWLEGESHAETKTLCGRQSVQVTPGEGLAPARLDLDALAGRLRAAALGEFRVEDGLLRGSLAAERAEHDDGAVVEITLFPNGRAIIRGTTRPERARAIYARFVGV